MRIDLGEAIFERLFELETKENKTKAEMEEYELLKELEPKKEYVENDEEDEEDEEEYMDEAERVGMTLTVLGWM